MKHVKRALKMVWVLIATSCALSVYGATTSISPIDGTRRGYATDTGWAYNTADMEVGYEDNAWPLNNVQSRAFAWFNIPSEVTASTVNSATLTVTVKDLTKWNSLLSNIDLYDLGSLTLTQWDSKTASQMYTALAGANLHDWETKSSSLTFSVLTWTLQGKTQIGFAFKASPEIPSGSSGDQSNWIMLNSPTLTINYTGIVSTPSMSLWPGNGTVGQDLLFSAGSAACSISSHSVQYQFDWGDGTQSSWGSSSQYKNYSSSGSYQVKVRAKCATEGSTSSWSSSTTVPISADSTSPTPNPMTWSTSPYGSGRNSISMTASTASDSSGVEYYFDETSGLAGGADSGWQDSRTYVNSGLTAGQTYSYKVKARDKSSSHNETSFSDVRSAKPDCYGLTVASSGASSGVTIGVSPSDYDGKSSGSTSFLRQYSGSTQITLTAPSTYSDGGTTYNFSNWSGADSANGTTAYVTLNNANKTVTANYSAQQPATTKIIRLAGSLSFGSVAVGSTSQKTLTIYNDGNSTLTVSVINYPSGFSGNWSGSISDGSSHNVTVMFSPSSATSYSGNVTVSSDATSGGNTLSISGTGTITADTQSPSISITSPTMSSSYTSSTNRLNLAGTASDNVSVSTVTAANNRDIADYLCSGTTSWSLTGMPLYSGQNYISVIAADSSGNTNTDTVTVNYTGDSSYEDVLRSGAIVQDISFSDNLIPGSTVTVQWELLSYVPVRARLGTGSESGSWSLYKNAEYQGSVESPWNISGRHANVYAFECSYTVPQQPGDFVVWFNVAQTDGDQYMAAVIPDGVDSRPHPTQSKLILRTIPSGGANLNPQSDTSYYDSTRPFESIDEHKRRSGGTITYISLADNLVSGTSVTCQWKVLSYIDVKSKFSIINLTQQQIWQTVTGTQIGSPATSTWNFTDRSGTQYYAKEYTFQATFTVANQPGNQQIYFLNQESSSSSSAWMSGNIPAGVDSRPVSYNSMYGRFIERTIQ